MSTKSSLNTKTKRIIAPFNKASHFYDQYAMVQHTVGQQLLNGITTTTPRSILDIGCGTGITSIGLSNRFPSASIDAIDAASRMIEHCQNTLQKPTISFLQRNFLTDPIPNHYDLIVSNATFQWFSNLQLALTRCREHLNPNGGLCFTLFGPKTFQELAAIIKKHSTPPICLAAESFPNKKNLTTVLETLYRSFTIRQSSIYVNFPSLIHLLKSIKCTGTRGDIRNGKLWTPSFLNKIEKDYLQTYGTICASYDVYFVNATI